MPQSTGVSATEATIGSVPTCCIVSDVTAGALDDVEGLAGLVALVALDVGDEASGEPDSPCSRTTAAPTVTTTAAAAARPAVIQVRRR